MTPHEISRIKARMASLLDLQISAVKTKIEILETNGAEVLGTTDQAKIKKEIDDLKTNRYSVLKQLNSQAQAATTAEELKVIHDKIAEVLGIKAPNN